MRAHALTWITLLTLSAVSFRAGGSEGDALAGTILLATSIKCLLVGWQFMGLRSAHLAWRLGFVVLVSGLPLSVYLLAQTH